MTKQEFLDQYSVMMVNYENDVIVRLEDLNERELQSENDFLGDLIASLTWILVHRKIDDPLHLEAARLLYEIYRDCND